MKLLVIADTYPSEDSPVACIFIKKQVDILKIKYDLRVLVIGRRFIRINVLYLIKYLLRKFSGIIKNWVKVKIDNNETENEKNKEDIFRIEYPVFTFLKFPIHILNGISVYLTVLMTFRKMGFGPDLIYAHKSFPSGYAGWWLKRKYNIPVVTMEFQGPFSSYFIEPYRGKRVIKTINNIDRTIYTGVQLKAIEAHGGNSERLGLAHFGIDINRFTFNRACYDLRLNDNKKGNFKLLIIGRVEEAKGIRYLMGAIERLRQEFPRISLTIAGPVDDEGKKITRWY